MKPALILSLCLAPFVLADSPPQAPVPVPIPLNEDGSLSEEGARELQRCNEARERWEYHTPLNGILAFIHDRASADAAAPREWLTLAATIRDKESADAAADGLMQKSAELGTPLHTSWHDYAARRKNHGCMLQLATVMENVVNYLRCASPAFFGSRKLQQLLAPGTEE